MDEISSLSDKFNRATKFSLSSKKLLMWSKFKIMIGDIDQKLKQEKKLIVKKINIEIQEEKAWTEQKLKESIMKSAFRSIMGKGSGGAKS